jgi:hypothetical protein
MIEARCSCAALRILLGLRKILAMLTSMVSGVFNDCADSAALKLARRT